MTANLEGALELFECSLDYVARFTPGIELDWQRRVQLQDFTETEFLREAAWVILCSGFRERIVRNVFGHISLCFCDWESASSIIAADPACRIAAMASFRNQTKLKAIVDCAARVYEQGFRHFKAAVLADPMRELLRLPYIGSVTVRHLAKNLGLDVAKPDRHLVRISSMFGFESADHLCSEISRISGEHIKIVDLVVWRYIADNPQVLRRMAITIAV